VSPHRSTPAGLWRSVDTRGPLRRTAAFLVAGAALGAVVGWLLLQNYWSIAQRRSDLLREHAAALILRAAVLGNTLDQAESALRGVGDSPEVVALLESLELGMSEQYGLALSRAAIRDRLRRITRPGQFGPEPPFSHVALLDREGDEVAGVGPSGDASGISWNRLSGGEDGVQFNPDGTRLVAVHAVTRGGKPAGALVAWLSADRVTRALVQEFKRSSAPAHSYLVDAAGVPFRGAGLRHVAPLPHDAQAVPPDGVAIPTADESRGGVRSVVARVAVPGRRLFVVDVHPHDEFFRDVPSESAAANLAAAVALVLGAVVLGVVLNVRALIHRTRQDESSVREREVGEKTEALEREANERLRAERSRAVLANALEQSTDAVAIANTSLHIDHVNAAFEQMTGRPAAAARGRMLLETFAPAAAATPEGQELLACIREGRPWRGVLAGAREDGQSFDARVSVAPVRDASGTVTHHVLTARDVTDELREQERRRHAQRLEAIGTLAGGVAHDFNNLLTAINGYAGIALEDLRPGDPLREDIEEIRSAGARAADLTRQLLAFGRRQVLNPESLDPGTVVEGIQKMLRRIIGEQVDLVTDLQPDAWRVRADRGQLEQVLVNLAVNARDAMPSGGRLSLSTANVRVSEAEARRRAEGSPGEFVRLRVVDTGVGMPREVLDRVFEPFFTTKDQGKGTGLGLSTVYGIVRQSQGFVGVTSAPGAGSTFDVFLPRDTAHAGAEAAGPGRDPARVGAGEVILVVEDEEQVRSLVVSQLSTRGYAVLSAADGREALRIAEKRTERIDLLVADVVMPRMSGPELARLLARSHPETVVIFMSGYAEEAVLPSGGPGEDVAFIGKPFEVEALCVRIQALLARSGRTRPSRTE
jgi:PAS domain S-box-containing protein